MAVNVHGTAVAFGSHGVLITGPSGSGKSGLALALLAHARIWAIEAALVADDQVLLAAENGRVVASAPIRIAGLIELRGVGPVPIAHLPGAPIDLLVRLVPPADAARLPEPETASLVGITVAARALAAGDRWAAAMAVAGHFGLPPFAKG